MRRALYHHSAKHISCRYCHSSFLPTPVVDENGIGWSGGSASIPGRLVDGGRFMHRLDIPNVGYSGPSALAGSIVLAAMPRHFALTQRAIVPPGTSAGVEVDIEFDGAALQGLTVAETLAGGRGVRLTGPAGEGWVFFVPAIAGTAASVAVQASGALTATLQTPENFFFLHPGRRQTTSHLRQHARVCSSLSRPRGVGAEIAWRIS